MAVAIGVFFGLSPFWGYQLAIALGVAALLKVNKPIVVLTSHISLPPFIPFIVYYSYRLGGIMLGNDANDLLFTKGLDFDSVKHNLLQFSLGSFAVATAAGLIFGGITHLLLVAFRGKTLPKT